LCRSCRCSLSVLLPFFFLLWLPFLCLSNVILVYPKKEQRFPYNIVWAVYAFNFHLKNY
jgi:hypothetical protein